MNIKVQDIVFLAALAGLIFYKNPKYATIAGLCSLLLAIPLFLYQIFFTAQRLTWYAAVFLFLATVLHVIASKKVGK